MAMEDRLNDAAQALRGSAIREFSRLAAQVPDCVRLTLGEPDFDTPAPICGRVGEALAAGETHYIENSGAMALRRRLSDYEAADGLNYPPEDIIVTAGATEALFAALTGVLNPGDEVIVPTPAFVLYERIVGLCRGVFVPMDTAQDGFQLDARRLEALITANTKAIVINSPNNPTGCVYTRESLAAVADAARKHDLFVICDDVYRKLCYRGECPAFAALYPDLRDRIIVVESFSKPYAMTGWRVGWLMADGPVSRKLALIHQFMVTSTPAPFQRACMEALDYDPADMVRAFGERCDYAWTRLAAMGLEAPRPRGAFYVFPSIRPFGMDSTTFCTRMLREAAVAATPGSAFGADDHIRVSCCCGMERLTEGLDRIECFVRALSRRN